MERAVLRVGRFGLGGEVRLEFLAGGQKLTPLLVEAPIELPQPLTESFPLGVGGENGQLRLGDRNVRSSPSNVSRAASNAFSRVSSSSAMALWTRPRSHVMRSR